MTTALRDAPTVSASSLTKSAIPALAGRGQLPILLGWGVDSLTRSQSRIDASWMKAR